MSTAHPKPATASGNAYALPWRFIVVMLLWGAATAAALGWVIKGSIATSEREFAEYGERFLTQIRDKLRANEAVLYGFSSFLGAIDRDDRETASMYARSMLERYPHIYMLEVARRVGRRDLAGFTQTIRRKWYKDFSVRRFDYRGERRWLAAAAKDLYYPIILAEPELLPEQSILGLDIDSLDGLRTALTRSEQQGAPAASEPFRLVEGDLAYVLFRTLPPIRVRAAERDSILGDGTYALMVIRARDLLPPQREIDNGVRHSGFMGSSPDGTAFFSIDPGRPPRLAHQFFPPLRIDRDIGDSTQPLHIVLERDLGLTDVSGDGLAAVSLASIFSLALLLGYVRSRRHRELRLHEERQAIEHMALHDALTGLPNRFLLLGRLEQALTTAQRHGSCLAVLFLDLDGFKPINDTFGHHIGDELLKAVSRRLRGCIRDCDTVARHGGDEFVVALTDIRSPDDAAAVAEKILHSIAEPVRLGGHEVCVTTSIGIAIHPDSGSDPESLLRAADAAMYEAKAEGRRMFRFATPDAAPGALGPVDKNKAPRPLG